MIDRRTFLVGAGAGLTLLGCDSRADTAPAAPRALPASLRAALLIAAARRQVGTTIRYDSGYARIPFPNGDVPRERGVCTDVLIRAYRDAFGADLQALVNADMRAAFGAYPRNWGLSAPDRNIDHRRVPNLATWFRRRHAALPVPSDGAGWQPGDIFTSRVGGNAPHIGIVSDRAGARGPLIIHNVGAGTREEDALLLWPITGRFRWSV